MKILRANFLKRKISKLYRNLRKCFIYNNNIKLKEIAFDFTAHVVSKAEYYCMDWENFHAKIIRTYKNFAVFNFCSG